MDEQILICQKHNHREKDAEKALGNCFICLNRYCSKSYQTMCKDCLSQHRDHHAKILTLEDTAYLLDQLLTRPFLHVADLMEESIEVLRKFNLIFQFSQRIFKILMSLQQQTYDLIGMTQNIISDYAKCKNGTNQLSTAFSELKTCQEFEKFKLDALMNLKKVDFNVQKDRLQFGSLQIRQKQQSRKKGLGFIKRKIEQVKQYNMKIIEVILHNDSEQQHDITIQKKLYDSLKNEFSQKHIEELVTLHKISVDESVEKDTQQSSEYLNLGVQTQNQWIEQLISQRDSFKEQLIKLKKQNEHEQAQKVHLSSLIKQKQAFRNDRDKAYTEKKQIMEETMRQSSYFAAKTKKLNEICIKRQEKQKQRQKIIQRMVMNMMSESNKYNKNSLQVAKE